MRDFVLDDGFLQSCIDLPKETREKIVSQLQIFARNDRDRDLGVGRVDGSRHILLLPVDNTYCVLLRRDKPVITLLAVIENKFGSKPVVPKRGKNPEQVIIAPVDALETLLVEGKYVLLAKHLLKIPAATRELEIRIPEIEIILNAHLPPEARRFQNWWANQKSGKRAHAFAWMAAGWLVSKVDFNAGVVKFIRRSGEPLS